jgi:outer membrane protein assembly factor BamD
LKGLSNFNKGKGFTQRYLPTDESQRDPGAALHAFQSFSELIKRYPDSEYVADSEQRMRYLRNVLAKNEVHVANYYMRRGAFIAAANRARYVIENYPRTPSVPDALVVLAKTYRILEMNDLSDDALRVLELNYPNHPGAYEAKNVKVK